MMPFFFGLESGPEAWTALFSAGLRRGYPVFEHIIQYCDPALVEELIRLAVAGGMICASFEAYLANKEEWLRDVDQVLNDLLKSADFLSVAVNLDLDFQDGSLHFEGFGYAGRFADVWGPQPQVRRTVGDVVWHAAWLRGGGADGADFAGIREGGGGFIGDVAEDNGAEEVLSDVEELGSDDVDAVVRVFDDAGDVDAVGDVGAVADEAELFDEAGIVSGAGAVAEDGAGVVGDVSAAA